MQLAVRAALRLSVSELRQEQHRALHSMVQCMFAVSQSEEHWWQVQQSVLASLIRDLDHRRDGAGSTEPKRPSEAVLVESASGGSVSSGSADIPGWVLQAVARDAGALEGVPDHMVCPLLVACGRGEEAKPDQGNESGQLSDEGADDGNSTGVMGQLQARLAARLRQVAGCNALQQAAMGTTLEPVLGSLPRCDPGVLLLVTRPVLHTARPRPTADRKRRNRTIRAIQMSCDIENILRTVELTFRNIVTPLRTAMEKIGSRVLGAPATAAPSSQVH